MQRNSILSSHLFGAILGLSMGFASTAQAVPLALESTPLFLSNQADPNVFFEIDDSGSMDWEILINQNTVPSGTSTTNGVLGTGASSAITYLFNNPDNVYSGAYWSGIATDWRAFCACLNVMAYDPSVTYVPWKGFPTLTISDIATLKNDPQPGKNGYTDLHDATADTYYTGWIDSNSNGDVDTGDAKTTVFVTSLPDADKINYAHWYQYHRRRSFVAKAAVSAVVNDNPQFRYGLSLINDWEASKSNSVFVEVPASTVSNYVSHNNAMLAEFFDYKWEGQGTPLRTALKRTGQYFDNAASLVNSSNSNKTNTTTDPITSECQKNFAILFTDGFWNGSSPSLGNTDGDPYSNSLADVAEAYYDTDLSTFPDNVPADSFDTNKRQHMVTFTVAFGINGNLVDTDSDSWPNPVLTKSSDWGNPNSDARKVDDLWHAAFNGKGTFVAAQTPDAVAKSLNDALANIASRSSSAASVALNAGSIGANSRVYQAKFDTDKWSGQVLSFTVNLSGAVSTTPNWDAGCKITGGTCPTTGGTETTQDWDTGREIITFKPSTSKGIPFRWPANPASPTTTELDQATQTDLLEINFATTLTDGLGSDRLEYLRGKRTLETITFRTRDSVLGDVIHSAPVYIGAPSLNYPDSLESAAYSTFRNTHKSRRPIIWFGSNDGMFHGVDASLVSANQGKEVIAYIPSSMFSHLNELASPSYAHRYYVDGVPSAGDVFFGSSWKTVIVSGLAAGGQGLFGLDVTNPGTFTEANADNIALWEFNDGPAIGTSGSFSDRDMGYSYGQPSIVKLQNGVWAAVFGNGYGNTHDDDNDGGTTNDSLTGNSVIYIVNIKTGAIIRKFDTGVGSSDDPLGFSRPNGMSSPTVVDIDNDKKADYIFAGDLFGNVWKIDISGSTSGSWKFDYSTSSPHTPLFVTDDGAGTAQPITTAPEVSKHEKGGFLVHIGTGKYIETGDNSQISQQTQSFYGLWDKDGATLTAYTRSHLLKQEITKEEVEQFDINQDGSRGASEGESDVRETTKNAITWHTGTGLPSGGTHLGWYIDLFSKNIVDGMGVSTINSNNFGERQVTSSTLIDGVIFFNTLIPSDSPCDFGGDSWIMALHSDSGERIDSSVFDLDLNGVFDAGDGFDAGSLVSGVKSKVGILPRLTFAKGYGGGEWVAFGSGSSGGFMTQRIKRLGESFGRQSWDQILE